MFDYGIADSSQNESLDENNVTEFYHNELSNRYIAKPKQKTSTILLTLRFLEKSDGCEFIEFYF